MPPALFSKQLKNDLVQCQLCPHFCTLKNNETGKCHVRKNIAGELKTLVYAKPCSINIDPIEKKPLYHFHPGTKTLSIATVGCNLDCKHCQNSEISQANPESMCFETVPPDKVIELCKKNNCKIISYTYTEPTIFFEYMLDIAKLAKKNNIKNVMVSNGFINPEPLKQLCQYLDAANVDLKAFTNEFYKDVCSARLDPVLETLKILKQNNVWLELTNLIIPKYNDDLKKIEEMCVWIKENLSKDTPLHLSRFFPMYKLLDAEPTPQKTLQAAFNIAKKRLNFVYLGNLQVEGQNNTFCPNCNKLLIDRFRFKLEENNIINNKCKFCEESIAGVF